MRGSLTLARDHYFEFNVFSMFVHPHQNQEFSNSLNFEYCLCKVHPHFSQNKASQQLQFHMFFIARYARTFSILNLHKIFFCNRRIARFFKVRYARTFLRIKFSNSLNFTCCHCKIHPHSFNFDVFLFVGNLCKNWIFQICAKSLSKLDMVTQINNSSAFCHNKSRRGLIVYCAVSYGGGAWRPLYAPPQMEFWNIFPTMFQMSMKLWRCIAPT